MRNKKPTFEIMHKIIDYVAKITELVDHLTVALPYLQVPRSAVPTASEPSFIPWPLSPPLSQEQVTAVQNRKHVLAPPKDIAEVKNAYEIYKRPDELDPYSVDSFLTALGIMTQSMVDCEGNVSYFGILPQYVPYLVMELLD